MVNSQNLLVKPEKNNALVKCQKCGNNFKPLGANGNICMPCLFPASAINIPVTGTVKAPDTGTKKAFKPGKSKNRKTHPLTPVELEAVKTAYLPMLPMPEVNCHKTIAEQTKIPEHKVYKGIGIVRRQMKLPRFIEREGYMSKNGTRAVLNSETSG